MASWKQRRSRAYIAAILLIGAALPASAEDTPDYASMLLRNESLLTDPPKTCDDPKAALNSFQLQQCSATAFKAADAALNTAYDAALRNSDAGRAAKLRSTQRLWLQLRNQECDWEASRWEGGSLAPIAMGNCLVDITRARVKTLENDQVP